MSDGTKEGLRRAVSREPGLRMRARVLATLNGTTADEPRPLTGSLAIVASAMAEEGIVVGVRCPNRGPLRWYIAHTSA